MNLKSIFRNAQRNRLPVFQFNFSDISQLKGILNVTSKFKQPFILGTSEGESQFLGLKFVITMKKEAERVVGSPVISNLDHSKSFTFLKKAIDAGYQMVHFDGSSMSFRDNIRATKKVVRYARKKNVLVEGELGVLRGSSRPHRGKARIQRADMTSPEEAERFVKETGIDALSPVFGNIHGTYNKMPSLDLRRLSMIKNRIGKDVFLVLHGGSGLSSLQMKRAVDKGIVKINVNTEIRIAWRTSMERAFKNYRDEVAPYKLMPGVVNSVERTIEKRIKLFYGHRS